MRNIFPVESKEFGIRLKTLMECNNLSTLVLASKLCGFESKPKSNTKEYDECLCKAKTIRNHLKLGDLTKTNTSKSLAVTYLAEYCNFFKCSADYFLGYIDYPTKEYTDIGDVTGLSKTAIETLKFLNQNNGSTVTGHNEISTLNTLLSDSLCTLELLAGIEDFLNICYRIPVYHTGRYEVKDNLLQPECIIPNNDLDKIDNTYLLNLTKDATNPNDNYSIPLNKSFFESIALNTIQKAIIELRSAINEK